MTNSAEHRAQVVAIRHTDKFSALEQVLDQTRFFEILERHWRNSKKSKGEYLIAIKPNIMTAHSRQDPSTITDPELVERLIDGIVEHGFTNTVVVESQNIYSNWFRNRDVVTVASYYGYSLKNYRVVDLTQEMVPYDYGGRLGQHWVGPSWRDADFRISFAKNKTHMFNTYTLTLKNLFGCLPLQAKYKEYHVDREYDWVTIEMLKHFPCHFGLIDGVWSADGLMGVKSDYTPRHTQTIIGGQDIIAVEWVGAKKMDIDPFNSRMFTMATTAFGMPEVEWVGDQSLYEDWVNIPRNLDKFIDIAEENYTYLDWVSSISSEMEPAFPPKPTHLLTLFARRVFTWILRLISRLEG